MEYIQQSSQPFHCLHKHRNPVSNSTITSRNLDLLFVADTAPQRPTSLSLFQLLIMENFRPPFHPSTTSTSTTPCSSTSSTPSSSSSLPDYYPAVQYRPPHPYWQQQQPLCLSCAHPMYPYAVPLLASDATHARAAREQRRIARKRRSFIMKRRNAARAASSDYSRMVMEGERDEDGSDAQENEQEWFFTPSNKKLRLLFEKELKNSDVRSLGRIVLPKRPAEKYLPSLSDKEGVQFLVKVALSNQEWGMRYKYWTNNNSRMYVLENTGDFVRQNGGEVGDMIHIYEDERKNLYISIGNSLPSPVHVGEPLTQQQNYNNTKDDVRSNGYSNHAVAATTAVNDNTTVTNKDHQDTAINNNKGKTHADESDHETNYIYNEPQTEEVASFSAVLLQQEPHKEQIVETNNLETLLADEASSHRQSEEASNSNNDVPLQVQTNTSQQATSTEVAEDNFGDLYEGLGPLPEVHRFQHLFYFDD